MSATYEINAAAPVSTILPALELLPCEVAPSTAVAVIAPAPLLPLSQRRAVVRTDVMVPVKDIATLDGLLAQTLHERLDFSAVIQHGARVSDGDAYNVLTPYEFARYEVVRGALTAKSDAEVLPVAAAVISGLVAILAIPAAYITMHSGVEATMLSAAGSTFAFFGVKALFDFAGKQQARIEGSVPAKLAALPAPARKGD